MFKHMRECAVMNKRQAIKEVRACADSVIEQLTRFDKGWDKGMYRDDDVLWFMPIKRAMRLTVADAFKLAKQFN